MSLAERPLVSIVLPARNEADYIAGAIESIKAQSYPLDRMELLVVDGASTDATVEMVHECVAESIFASFEVIDNPEASTPSNLNAGLERAKGDVVVRVDGRSRLPSDYVSRCVELLEQEVAVVGGRQIAAPNGPSTEARGIARSLNNRFAMGGAAYRTPGSASGPVDTVYLGAFRRQDLVDVGGWSMSMASNQDYELNQRLSDELGWPVWFDSDLEVQYLGRSRLVEIGKQYHRFGRWKMRYWRAHSRRPQPRQILLLVGPPVASLLVVGVAIALPNRRLLPFCLAAIGALFGADAVGSAGPEGGPITRTVAVGSMSLVGIGWWTGVARQFLVRDSD